MCFVQYMLAVRTHRLYGICWYSVAYENIHSNKPKKLFSSLICIKKSSKADF